MASGLSRQYCAYFGEATEVWKRHVIGVTIEAFDEYRDSVCQTLQNITQDSSRPVPDGSAGGRTVNNQEEMSRNVQTAMVNVQHLAQKRIADTLAQTFNAPPPILVSTVATGGSIFTNQTIQVNLPVENAISHGGVISGQNDSSLGVSIKSEVDSSSESECESETDDEEVQIKEEPNEKEDIIPGLNENDNDTDAPSQQQAENTNNLGDHHENSDFQLGNLNNYYNNSTEGSSEQNQSNEAMAIDEELAEQVAINEQDCPVIIEVQYSTPPSSPSNAEGNDSFAGQQGDSVDLIEDIPSDNEGGHVGGEDEGDNMEYEENDLDGEESDNEEDAIIDEQQLQNAGEESDHLENQVNISGNEDNEEDSNNDTIDGDYEEDETEEERAVLGVAGPSTSAQDRRGTRRVAKRQIVSGQASKRQRIGRDVVTVPLGIITKKLKCTVPGCKKMVKSKRSMNRHLLSKHQLKEYRCLVRRCHGKVSTSFSTQVQLNDHRDQVHGSLAEWTCKCAKKFKSYNELNIHYWQYHELGHFTCSKDGCPVKSTTTRARVKNHQYKHSETKHRCPVDGCGWSFKKKSTLDSHLLTHSGERPFPCPECDKSFPRKADLTRHLLTHSGERPFPCPECDKSFTEKGTLMRHLRIHRNDKCFRCTWPQCTFSSSDRSHVIRHIRIDHFKLPRYKKQQLAAGIVDDRDARDYLAKN